MKNIFTYLLLILIIASCSKQPDCNDKTAKEMALYKFTWQVKFLIAYDKFYADEIEEAESLKETFMAQEMLSLFSLMGADIRDLEQEKAEAKAGLNDILLGNSTNENFKYNKYIKYADSIVQNGNITLENIRTNKVDKEIRKCDCEADLIFHNISFNDITVNYTVQITEENKIYVKAYWE